MFRQRAPRDSGSLAEDTIAGAGNSSFVLALAPSLKIYRRIDLASPLVSNLLKLNIALLVAIMCFINLGNFDWHGGQLLAVFNIVLAFTIFLSCVAAIMTNSARGKRLVVLADRLVVVEYLTRELYSERSILWSELDRVSIVKEESGEGENDFLAIKCGSLVYRLKLSDVLLDQSEAELVNAVETYAPGALENSSGRKNALESTELWLHRFAAAVPRENVSVLSPGQILDDGRLEILGVVGGGGQGNAYEARALSSIALVDGQTLPVGERCLLKEYVLPVYRGADLTRNVSERFEREALILQKLRHPGVVGLYHHFVQDYRGYLVLEYVPGRSLERVVEEDGPLAEVEALRVGIKLALVLKYLHEQYPPLLHRDLSPDNIMLAADGDGVKVVDFNVAREMEVNSSRNGSATVVGKLGYLPPEQFRGKPTCQSDIYALGATLFYAVTGLAPVALERSSPMASAPGSVSPAFDRLVARATEPTAARRHASAEELLLDLSSVQR